MTEEPQDGKSRRKKRKKSAIQFIEITLSELIDISNEPFLVEGMVLSTTRAHLQEMLERRTEIAPANEFPLLPDEDVP